jgi:hypothetical protein
MPRPSLLILRASAGLVVGGMRLSKLSFRRASFVAGVLAAPGVRHGACAGLGVTLTKSAKLKLVPGVLGPKPRKPAPLVPGVMCEDGSGVDLAGGVDGAWIAGLTVCCPLAGLGEVARYISKSAPSSPSLGVRDHATLCAFLIRLSGGGVCGGDEVIRVEELSVKLVTGKSVSSSSLNSGDGGSSGIVDPSEMKESCVRLCEEKRACLVWWIGDDSGNPCPLFHDRCRADDTRCLRPVIGPDDGNFCRSDGRILLLL